MKTIKVIFARNKKPLSLLIRLFTWSRWSHCGTIDGEFVIESKGGVGVVATPLDEFKSRYTDYALADLPVCDNVTDAKHRARAELGKPYDHTAIFGILFRTGWNSDDSWFCSEHVAHTSGIFRKERVGRITPEMIWSVSK